MMKTKIRSHGLVLALLISGCATMSRTTLREDKYPYYPATRENINMFKTFSDAGFLEGLVTAPFVLVDLPFSIVFDTLFLPFDLVDAKHDARVQPENTR